MRKRHAGNREGAANGLGGTGPPRSAAARRRPADIDCGAETNMQTIAIVNEKGGTGKTTTAVNLSAALGRLGKRVLLVDLDGQAASSRWLGVEEDTRFADALWRGEGLEPIPEVIPGVWLAPGSGKLDSVAHDLRPTQGGQLRKLLSQLGGFDYVLIDCPPSLGNRLIGNALLAATHAIVPVETSILALDGLKILLTTFEDIRQGFGHEIVLAGVLACRYDARTRLSRLILEELKRALPHKVFQTVIRENVRVRECPGCGQSILAYAPKSHAAEDYMSLAHEVIGLGARPPAALAAQQQLPHPPLTEDENQAAHKMRRQVDAMLGHFAPVEKEQPLSAGEGAWPAEQPPPCAPAETEPPPAESPELAPPAAESPPGEPEQPILNAPIEAPPATVEAAPEAGPTETSAFASAPPPQPEPPGDAEWVCEVPPAEAEAAPDVPAEKEETPAELPACQTPPSETPAQPEGQDEQTGRIGPEELEGPPPAAAAEDHQADRAEPAEPDRPAEPPPVGEAPDPEQDYPALRAMLQSMGGQDDAGASPPRAEEETTEACGRPAGWKKILRKAACVK